MKQTNRPARNAADYGYPSPDILALSEKALEVTQRLTTRYGEVPFSRKDPMSMLVDILLSHRTRDEQTVAAYDNLLQRFGSWEAVRDAPTEEVQDAIANVNWPEVKAPRIQAIMHKITEERGNLNLDFLCQLPVEEAAEWLNRFEGVGPKTTAWVGVFVATVPVFAVVAVVCGANVLAIVLHVHSAKIRMNPVRQPMPTFVLRRDAFHRCFIVGFLGTGG